MLSRRTSFGEIRAGCGAGCSRTVDESSAVDSTEHTFDPSDVIAKLSDVTSAMRDVIDMGMRNG